MAKRLRKSHHTRSREARLAIPQATRLSAAFAWKGLSDRRVAIPTPSMMPLPSSASSWDEIGDRHYGRLTLATYAPCQSSSSMPRLSPPPWASCPTSCLGPMPGRSPAPEAWSSSPHRSPGQGHVRAAGCGLSRLAVSGRSPQRRSSSALCAANSALESPWKNRLFRPADQGWQPLSVGFRVCADRRECDPIALACASRPRSPTP